MPSEDWLQVPIGRGADSWLTVRTQRTVLGVIHTIAGIGHILDAIELIEHDHRVQVVFTQAPDLFSNGVSDVIRSLGGIVIPWHQARETGFDLALAADCADIHRLSAPVLLLSHGVMNNKLAPSGLGGPGSGLVVGLSSPWLTWFGRLVPAMIALSHAELRPALAQQCQQALPVARVVGDLCLDRLVASRQDRRPYRESLGVGDGRMLVAVSSTWGPNSTFASRRGLLSTLVADLPAERYRVIVGLHPAVWFGHGPRQVMAWLSEQRRLGLRVVHPLSWRGLVAAADVMVGDHGSATVYAAAAGVPVLRLPNIREPAPAGSAVAALAESVTAVDGERPLAGQLDRVAAGSHETVAAIAARVTSAPGQAARLLRREIYRMLRLAELNTTACTTPVPPARVIDE